MHNLLILARNQLRFAINFLLSINFDSQDYNSNCYFIRIVLINHNNINKDNHFNNLIVIKANLRVRLFRLIKINYSKILIDLYYQISQSIVEELNSYRQLQELFKRVGFLVYFDRNRVLYIDIDVFKKRNFDAIIYYLKKDANLEKPRRIDVKFILFLSQLLNFAETRYWFIELEMVGLIWMVKRIKHIIETVFATTIVFIDYFVNLSIICQTILTSSNTNKLNLRSVRAFIYLSQFRLNIKYRLEKQYIIFDALSRLLVASTIEIDVNALEALDIDIYYSGIQDLEIFDQIYAYQNTLIAILVEFKQRLLDKYAKKKSWRDLINMLASLKKRIHQKQISSKSISNNSNQVLDNHVNREKFVLKKFLIEIGFELRDDLVYYFEKKNRLRLCISRTIEEKVFRAVYNDNYHFDYYRCYARINETLFVSRALNKIRIYVEHCLVY